MQAKETAPVDPAAEGAADYLGPRSPVRVMQIVEVLSESPQGLSLTQLSERLGIPKTSLLSHLRVMLSSEHVALQEARYLLGAASLRLGLVIAAGASVVAAARPLVEQLVQATGETAMVGMLDVKALEAVYVERRDGTHAVRFSPAIGARRPLYCTAFGRALLAFQDEATLARCFAAHALARITDKTVTSERALRKLLAEIRTRGVATTMEEHTLDAGAIAAPIFEQQGPVRYAIGIALPASRGARHRVQLEQTVADAAQKASWTLGGRWIATQPG